jgi:hypothetical protein
MFYIDGNEIKDKKYGNTLFYINGNEVQEKSKYGSVRYYIDGSLTKDQLMGLLSII